jgi:CMP-N-acetylneuraminic acid synthetase
MTKPICIIPARGGSKRIPMKNMQMLGDKTLLGRIITAAFESEVFRDVVVTTDDQNIMEEAYNYEAIGYWRDDSLASDDVRAEVAAQDALKQYLEAGNPVPPYVCVSMATAPFTKPETFRHGVMMMRVTAAEAVATVTEVPGRLLFSDAKSERAGVVMDSYKPLSGNWNQMESQSQDVPKVYRPTYGAMFVKTETLLESPTYYGKTDVQGVVKVGAIEGIDIDTLDDLEEARKHVYDNRRAKRH